MAEAGLRPCFLWEQTQSAPANLSRGAFLELCLDPEGLTDHFSRDASRPTLLIK
jgi:hypothetical protein